MNFTDFYAKWGTGGTAASLNERQGAQPHFMDLCALLGVPTPGSSDNYLFEQGTLLLGEARGYADVFKRDCFAWENKAPGRDLDKALKQLLGYSHALSNPPLLVVCDRLTIRIHTQFTGHPSEKHEIQIRDLDKPEKLAILRRVWLDPAWFRPKKTTRDITEAAAKSFATLAEGLRRRSALPSDDALTVQKRADQVAHFLTQCLFCFFAEDVGLLPDFIFKKMINAKLDVPTNSGMLPTEKLAGGLATLFKAMCTGDLFGSHDIVRFNGNLFKTVHVPPLSIMDITELKNAAELNWSAIDVSIFGTLFERGLDPKKRSQLGAHYTDPATIARIIDPVIRRPLLQKWELLRQEIRRIMALSKVKNDKHYKLGKAAFVQWLEDLRAYRILDPACGSGNFLFLGLKVLKDIEHQSHLEAAEIGLDRETDLVTGPHNMLGLELNEYAAELARVTVWIGELQWRLTHGYEFKTNPVLEPLDCIECRDALLQFTPEPVEATWPKASVVVGNPPFLGDKKMRSELGGAYTETLRKVYAGRVPGGADLVTYWFEKGRTALEKHGLGAAGLVSTNSIRGGKNRAVLDAICKTSRIYEAWSDEGWVNDGAAVHVSLIAFGHADQEAILDGIEVPAISSDLRSQNDAGASTGNSSVSSLVENSNVSFQGAVLIGDFEIPHETATEWLNLPNPHGLPNSDVLRPISNGKDINSRGRGLWVVDFNRKTQSDACLYEKPFEHALRYVKPVRDTNPRKVRREKWWIHGEHGGGWRFATTPIDRYIATSQVSKHRFFVWLPVVMWPHQTVITFARSDDATFGILHSRFHELWSLRMGTSLEDRPRYTPTTCFETFPFPAGLTPLDTASQQTRRLASGAVVPVLSVRPEPVEGSLKASTSSARTGEVETRASGVAARMGGDSTRTGEVAPAVVEAIAEAAHKLSTLRDNWLNPPDWTQRLPEVVPLGMTTSPYPDRIVPKAGHEKELSERTLTKLYNARLTKHFWLDTAHKTLDQCVATAYGWTDYTAEMPDEVILQRLLALNVERST
jgi:hypothetical protein